MIKTLKSTIVTIALISGFQVQAAPVKWTFGDTLFFGCNAGGTMANGNFVYDAATNAISDFNIVTDSIETGTICGNFGDTYTADVGSAISVSPSEILLSGELGSTLTLQFVTPLTDSGGTVALVPGWSNEANDIGYIREVELGWLTGTVVPVPAALWLFGFGLIGLIGIARRKSRV